jgi:hypothetical protein
MPKPKPLKYPVTHLKNLIATRGDSGRYWTSYSGANIVWNPIEHSHSDTYQDAKDILYGFGEHEEYREFLFLLTHGTDIYLSFALPFYNETDGCVVYVHRDEGNTPLEFTFVFPSMDAVDFETEVELLSHMSIFWAKTANREVKQVRAFISRAFHRWEDMEEEKILHSFEYESN